MANRKSAGRQTKKMLEQKDRKRRGIISIVLFFAAVLTFLIAVIKGNSGWEWLHNTWIGLFGYIFAYIVPIIMGYFGVIIISESKKDDAGKQAAVVLVGYLLVATTIDTFLARGESFGDHIVTLFKTAHWSGGVVGGLLGYPIGGLLGRPGAPIATVIITLAYLMIITGTTLVRLARMVSTPAKRIKEAADEAYDRRLEAELAAQQEGEQSSARRSMDAKFFGLNKFEQDSIDVPIAGEGGGEQISKSTLRGKQQRVISTYNDQSLDIPVSDDVAVQDGGNVFSKLDDDVTVVSDDAAVDKRNKKMSAEDRAVADAAAASIAAAMEEKDQQKQYKLPPIELLDRPAADSASSREEQSANAERLVEILRSFGVETRVIGVSKGPTITRYELQPAAGVKISKITNLANDIAMNLATTGVRIEAPIPNKAAVGIEVPNKIKSSVGIRALVDSDKFRESKSKITCAVGKDITGENTFMDISKMPHVLIAGTTGSGKSVCLNSLILSILYKATPDDVRLIMIDPKAVEMNVYNGIPHLLVPVVTDPRKASGTLTWAVGEMLKRYQIMRDNGVRNLDAYNKLAEKSNGKIEKLPQIVILIDELADLMMAAPNEVESAICRIAQLARAAGMHLVVATQRPSVDVITGLIKANIPSRIALTTANQVDSRTIIDMAGAEKLIGHGDMLYFPVGESKPLRVQGCWVSDEEIERVVNFLKSQTEKDNYNEEVQKEIDINAQNLAAGKKGGTVEKSDGDAQGEYDDMLEDAMEVVIENGQASTSLLQRKLRLGYARAARIMDQLEEKGVIGPFEGAKPRSVLMTHQQFIEMKAIGNGPKADPSAEDDAEF